MSLRKAAEMALEVFEHLSKGESPAITRGELVYEIAALRQALEESANSTTDFVEPKALAQPEQEPVDWEAVAADQAMTIAMMKIEQEPVAWMDKNSGVVGRLHSWENAIPLYTAPPKREWVGLTDEEAEILIKTAWNKEQTFNGLARAIEAKLKEKNA